MHLKIEKEELHNLFDKAVKKAGSLKNLVEDTKIPKNTLWNYKSGAHMIPNKTLHILCRYAKYGINKRKIIKKLPDNWGSVKGGKNCVKRKVADGTFEKQLILARKENSKKLVRWHKEMKENHPEDYYHIQYSRFKKVGEYKLKTKNGEKVRNVLEKEVADKLAEYKISYQYEPLIKAKGKYFFPDFVINNKIVIECTMWRGFDKAIKLKEKISYLSPKYKVYVVIPKALNNYYQILNNHLVLGVDEFVPVAQTFRDLK